MSKKCLEYMYMSSTGDNNTTRLRFKLFRRKTTVTYADWISNPINDMMLYDEDEYRIYYNVTADFYTVFSVYDFSSTKTIFIDLSSFPDIVQKVIRLNDVK